MYNALALGGCGLAGMAALGCGVESAVLGAICAIIAYLLGDAIFRAIAYA